MAPLSPHARVRRRCGAALLACASLLGCRGGDPEIRLEAQLTADGGATLSVRGPAGRTVTVLAARPWRGEETLHAGLVGERCSAEPLPGDAEAGIGPVAGGVLGDTPFVATIAAARLAKLPDPSVLQAVGSELRDGVNWLVLSNAWRCERVDGKVQLVPFSSVHGLLDAAKGLLLYLLVPLLVGGIAVWRLRRARTTTLVVPAMLLAAIVARGLAAPGTWPWQVWPHGDEITRLEQRHGAGLRQTLAAIDAARREHEALGVLAAPANDSQRTLAAHIARLVAGANVVSDAKQLPERGLQLVLGDQYEPKGTRLATTALGSLWRVGGDK